MQAPMVSGAAMNAECRVIETNELGGNAIFIGEVVHVQSSDVAPLIYHGGKYYKLGKVIRKPPHEELAKIRSLVEKYRK